jgi:hypothetical protein
VGSGHGKVGGRPGEDDGHQHLHLHSHHHEGPGAGLHHQAPVALHFMHYNFCRVHQTLRVTPALEAGITDHLSSINEVAQLLDRNANIAA